MNIVSPGEDWAVYLVDAGNLFNKDAHQPV